MSTGRAYRADRGRIVAMAGWERWRVAKAAALCGAAGLIAAGAYAMWPAAAPRPTAAEAASRHAARPPARRPAAAAASQLPPGASLIATISAPTPYSLTPGGPPAGRLPADNPFGTPTVLAVIGQAGVSGWLHVELPIRPNGSTGWIPAASATLTYTTYSVSVDLEARTLTVADAGRAVLSTPVAVGAPSSPTPAGHTYLWELIRPDDPSGPYGPYIFGLGEYSDTYATFNGGDAQIGIHGQDEPWSIGHAESHGCVRVPDPVIVKLAGMLPLGTPVTIG
jgi:lipoprotein-anchoring transpeptidase ErfK/SrfK